MKLSGKAIKNLNPKKKEILEDTVKRMSERREKDTLNLRDVLVNRLASLEKWKTDTQITVRRAQDQLQRIEGSIITIKECLEESNGNIQRDS
jgi:hypothetical protein